MQWLFRGFSGEDHNSIQKIMNDQGILILTPKDVLTIKLNCVNMMVDDKIKADSSSVVQKLEYKNLLTERWLKPVSIMVRLLMVTMKQLTVMKIAHWKHFC